MPVHLKTKPSNHWEKDGSELGMSWLAPIFVASAQSDQRSQTLLDKVEDATNNIINTQLARAQEVITSQRDLIGRLVEVLLDQETVEREEIECCFPRAA
jgi:ATP-dependent Zn protease